MLDLEAIELIKQLKARYFRLLDTADFEGLRTVFSENPAIHFRSPTYNHEKKGWDEMEAFFKASFTPTKFGIHNGHHPEISVEGDTAKGIWYLHDRFISLDDGVSIEGSALYHDQYIKEQGEWKIAFSEYDRLFEEITQQSPDAMLTAIPTTALKS